ncbi:asialoglycoprotein receptor 2-like [Lithobates pipiens]
MRKNTYANMGDLHLKRMKNASTAKEIPAAKNTHHRVILILGILLMFISCSHSSEVQSIRRAVRNLEEVQTAINYDENPNLPYEVMASFSSEIQRILEFMGKMAEELYKNSSNPLCSEGWSHYGLSCYYLSSDRKLWNNAKEDCENKEAHLVVINGQEEMNFLLGITNKQTFWIGLTDADGTWRWVDGTSYDITPKFWIEGQPDDWQGHGFGGGEDCAVIRDGRGWNDGHCSEIIKYICEKKMTF